MSDDRVIRNMRHMAWERAKGELNSMLHTYWDEHSTETNFSKMDNAITEFVRHVEDEGLHE